MTCPRDRKSTRLNSSHTVISYAVFCLKKKKKTERAALRHKDQTEHTSLFAQLKAGQPSLARALALQQKAATVGFYFFFFNDTATTEIYTLSLHDALPI